MTKVSEPDFGSYITSFEIFCAIETFTSTLFDFSTHCANHLVLPSTAIKLSARGRRSGGVAVSIDKSLMPFVTPINCSYDNICIKRSKAAVGLDKDVIFVAVYIPSYQSPYYKQTDTNCSIHHLEDFLLNLYQTGEDAYLVVCADLNARIGEWGFLTDDETDLLGNEIGRDSTRKSQDKNTDQFGKVLIDFREMFHCIPLNGNHSGDVDGYFTFISEQGNSAIDDCVVSSDFVCKTDMHSEVGSRVETSHMPIQLSIDSKQLQQEKKKKRAKETKIESMTKIKWDQEKAEEFHEAVSSETSKESIQEAFGLMETSVESALKKM